MIKPKETKTVLTYMDDRGWLYQVRQLQGVEQMGREKEGKL